MMQTFKAENFFFGGNLIIDESRDDSNSDFTSAVHGNDAAEAIKGLQALAEQPGLIQGVEGM